MPTLMKGGTTKDEDYWWGTTLFDTLNLTKCKFTTNFQTKREIYFKNQGRLKILLQIVSQC